MEAYCANGGNGTQAAITAGYAAHSAAVTASKLLKEPKIFSAVEERRAETYALAQKATMLTAEEVLQDLANAKRFDPALMYADDGTLLPVKDMPPEIRKQLEGLHYGKDGVKFLFPKKTAVREQAMKHFGLFEKDNAQQPTAFPLEIRIVPVRAARAK